MTSADDLLRKLEPILENKTSGKKNKLKLEKFKRKLIEKI